jgi:hypothetical protein
VLAAGATPTRSWQRRQTLLLDVPCRVFGNPNDLVVVTHKGGHAVLPEDLAAMAEFMTRHFGDPRDAQGRVRGDRLVWCTV